MLGMSAEDPYARHWRRLRWTYRWPLMLLIGWVPFVLVARAVLGLVAPLARAALVIPAAFYLAVCVFAIMRSLLAPCPRCGQPFASRGCLHDSFMTTCLHCGLSRGTTLAQVGHGELAAINLSGARLAQAVLAGSELLFGVLAFFLSCSDVALRAEWHRHFAAGIAVAFIVPGLTLLQRWRWRAWLQLLPLGVLAWLVWLISQCPLGHLDRFDVSIDERAAGEPR